jgi:molybdopterin synthase catalytic subunit
MAAPAGLSVIQDYGEAGSSCGYCGSKRPTSVQHGMIAESLSVEAYQALLDRWVGEWVGECRGASRWYCTHHMISSSRLHAEQAAGCFLA